MLGKSFIPLHFAGICFISASATDPPNLSELHFSSFVEVTGGFTKPEEGRLGI
jgi:hypothetical protein